VFSQNVIDSLNKKKEKKLQFDFQHIITKKEEIILELVSKGYTNLDISQKLNLSKRTIESHRYNLMKKLDLKTAHQLLSFAIYFFTSKQSIVK
jgi:DNA-binding NarL/FixJ family response regulator